MDAGFGVDPFLLGAGALLAVGVVAAGLADRLRFPGLLLFLGFGLLLGADGLGVVERPTPASAQAVGVVALLVILFEGGLTTQPSTVRRAAPAASALATVGVVVTAGVVALAAGTFFELEVHTALLIGAVVATTDAAAVFSVVRRSPLPRRLSSVLEVESGFNDPVAVLLTIGVLEAFRASPSIADWVVFGGVQLVGGLVLGVVGGLVTVRFLLAAPATAGGLLPAASLAAAAVTYGVAAWVGASGFLAVYVVGLVVSAQVNLPHRPIRVFNEGLASMAQIALFVTLGLLMEPGRIMDVLGLALVVTGVLVFVARPVAVALCLLPFRFERREVVVAGWAGLRGAVPIVLATFALGVHPDGNLVLDVVFFVVVVSSLLQGLTVSPLAKRLGLAVDPPPWAALVDLLPTDNEHFEIVELELSADAAVCGRTLAETPLPHGARVAVLVREGEAVVVQGATRLAGGDLLVVTAPRAASVGPDLVRWASGALPGDR